MRRIEFAFGGSFYDDPATLTWTDLSAYLSADAADVQLGRPDVDPDTPRAGTCSLVLIARAAGGGANDLNPGNPASPFYPNVVRGIPVRVTKDVDGVTWPVFYGQVESWSPSNVKGRVDWTVVQVTASSFWSRVAQAGPRMTVGDRVGEDFSGARGLGWMSGSMLWVEKPPATVGASWQVYPSGTSYNGRSWPYTWETTNGQKLGLAFLTLTNTTKRDWSLPGAECVVANHGGSGDWSGQTPGGASPSTRSLMPWSSSRPGGAYQLDASGNVILRISDRFQGHWQAMIGRPPLNLFVPALLASTAGWVTTSGSLAVVDAPSWAPHRTTYDPVTDATASVADGPAKAMQFTQAVQTGKFETPQIAVTAGKFYGPVAAVRSSTPPALRVRWYNASHTFITDTPVAASTPGTGTALWAGVQCVKAPAGAAYASIEISNSSGGGMPTTYTLAGVGWFEGFDTGWLDGAGPDNIWMCPARWWDPADSGHIYAWLQWTAGVGGTTATTAVADVTAWDDDAVHMLAFNAQPGIAGIPALWLDGVRSSTGWLRSAWAWNNLTVDTRSSLEQGFGWTGGDPEPVTRDTSTLTVWAALLGVGHWQQTPTDELVSRWWAQFGARETVADRARLTTTGAVAERTLDALGWPQVLRDIDPGNAAPATLGEVWANNAGLSDYNSFLKDDAQIEYGWVDVDQSGLLRWLPRAWWGDAPVAVAHFTYRYGTPGAITYQPPLPVEWDDPTDVWNRLVVSSGSFFALRQDLDSQRVQGISSGELPGLWPSQADVDEVADLAAFAHSPGPRITSLTVDMAADDPMLATLLGLRTGDAVLVTVPMWPGDDLVLSMLVTQIHHSSTPGLWRWQFGFTRCPVDATFAWTGPVFLGVDADGPYVDPAKAVGLWRLSGSDAEGWWLDTAGTWTVAVDEEGPYVHP